MPLLYELIFGLKPELATEDLPAREEYPEEDENDFTPAPIQFKKI